MKIQLFLKSIWKFMESIWQNILHILKILLLSSFFYNTFIIIYLSMGGPGRGYEEYILMTLFFTLAWAIFNAICLLVISPVALIILIIKNLRTEYKWIIIFILLSIFSEAVWYYEFPAYDPYAAEPMEFDIFLFLRAVSINFTSLILAYYGLYFWSKTWQKKFLK